MGFPHLEAAPLPPPAHHSASAGPNEPWHLRVQWREHLGWVQHISRQWDIGAVTAAVAGAMAELGSDWWAAGRGREGNGG